MTGAIGLVTWVVFGAGVAAVCGSAIGLAFAVLWYVLPLLRRRERGEAGAG